MDGRVRRLDILRIDYEKAESKETKEHIRQAMCSEAEGRCDLCRVCSGWKRAAYIPEWHQRSPIGMGGWDKKK